MYTTTLATSLLVALLGSHASATSLALFQPWNADDWTASDDTVRGGLSESYLEIINASSVARFYGTLDDTALSGSGFASQRTADDWAGLDLSAYDRITLEVAAAGGSESKTYSINLKDNVTTVNGVEQATVSWEYTFQAPAATSDGTGFGSVEVLFADLVPTYRGSVQNDTDPLDLTAIKRVNFMMRT